MKSISGGACSVAVGRGGGEGDDGGGGDWIRGAEGLSAIEAFAIGGFGTPELEGGAAVLGGGGACLGVLLELGKGSVSGQGRSTRRI